MHRFTPSGAWAFVSAAPTRVDNPDSGRCSPPDSEAALPWCVPTDTTGNAVRRPSAFRARPPRDAGLSVCQGYALALLWLCDGVASELGLTRTTQQMWDNAAWLISRRRGRRRRGDTCVRAADGYRREGRVRCERPARVVSDSEVTRAQ
jgi:hypothetical protein